MLPGTHSLTAAYNRGEKKGQNLLISGSPWGGERTLVSRGFLFEVDQREKKGSGDNSRLRSTLPRKRKNEFVVMQGKGGRAGGLERFTDGRGEWKIAQYRFGSR